MSVEEQLERLEQRLHALESRSRFWNKCAAAGVLAVAAALLMAQLPATAVLETRGLVVRDATGAARVQLGVADGAPNLSLYDSAGTLRAGLTVEPEGPILNLFTSAGKPRLVLGERADAAFVILRDHDGAPRAAMAVQDDGSPTLYLLDAKMNPLFRKP